ncbi:tetratricopeptide repeat protein [Acaryochloris marina]|uniref:tetratricopeptide repeat protein n=1 Tax=Acaryochloris marina TaxID=155978 RepID=UPI001BB0713C|nr:tetratricopeptide repeat protein [Acaryochloris marina]QUY42858.1 tetratricopeptide repeat protein [Acaryochloris marina S15]
MTYDPQIYSSYELGWQLHSKAGNQSFQAGRYAEARQAYRKAISLAELMLMTAKKERHHPEAIHAYVISCHNLADNSLKSDEVQAAETTMQQALAQVIDLMYSTQYSQCLRFEAAKALEMVSLKAYELYQNLGQSDKAQAVFELAAEQAQTFFSQMQPHSLST